MRSSTSMYDIHKARGSSGFDHGEQPEYEYKDLLRSIDRQFATLHPLMDSATFQATRCKSKSQMLDKLIDKATTTGSRKETAKK